MMTAEQFWDGVAHCRWRFFPEDKYRPAGASPRSDGEWVKYEDALAYAAAQLAELTAKLPETFFVGHDLAFRLERLVDGWQRAVTANLTLEAQLAEKEREIADLQTQCRDIAVALGNQIARAEAAEQRLQEAQARIKYLENVKVRAERGERSTS